MNDVIRSVIALTRSDMQRSGVLLHTSIRSNLPQSVGDHVQLQQVVLNLILNAIDSMADLTSRVRELRISTERQVDDLVVAVRDSGSGFGADCEGRLFEAFYSTKAGGMGMGLSICRSIVEAHGGRIWASANSDCGVILQFSLPLRSSGI